VGKETKQDFKDTGLFDSDGITNNNTITVDGLKEGETWQSVVLLIVNFSF
jgi:hypothetical protein